MSVRSRSCNARIAALLLAVIACSGGEATPGGALAPLTQQDLLDGEALVTHREQASDGDRTAASGLLAEARSAGADGRWSAANKLYGESALLFPSGDALLGYGHSLARVDRSSASDVQGAKKSDFETALRALAAARRLETAEPDPGLRERIEASSKCLQSLVAQGGTDASGCLPSP